MSSVYRLDPEYTANGEFYSHWADDSIVLMDAPHHYIGSVLDRWNSVDLKLLVRQLVLESF